MSMFIHAIIVILLAVLAMGIGLLILVCWALAACASRRDSYLDNHWKLHATIFDN